MEEDNAIESCTSKKVLEIFAKANLSCNLRVLGSQLGLRTSHLDEIETLPYRERMIKILDRVADSQGLSWSLLASILRKPALKEYTVAFAIERYSSTNRSTSSSYSESSAALLRSLSTSTSVSSPEASITSITMDIQGEISWLADLLIGYIREEDWGWGGMDSRIKTYVQLETLAYIIGISFYYSSMTLNNQIIIMNSMHSTK